MRTIGVSSTQSPRDAATDRKDLVRTRGLQLWVMATTDAGIRSALAAARDLSRGLSPEVVLLVPHVIPYPQALDAPPIALAFTERRVRALAEEAGIDVRVSVCLTRTGAEGLEPLLPRHATVLVGGSARRWWPTRAQQLARRLSERGHHVIFIDATAPSRPTHLAATTTSQGDQQHHDSAQGHHPAQ